MFLRCERCGAPVHPSLPSLYGLTHARLCLACSNVIVRRSLPVLAEDSVVPSVPQHTDSGVRYFGDHDRDAEVLPEPAHQEAA